MHGGWLACIHICRAANRRLRLCINQVIYDHVKLVSFTRQLDCLAETQNAFVASAFVLSLAWEKIYIDVKLV